MILLLHQLKKYFNNKTVVEVISCNFIFKACLVQFTMVLGIKDKYNIWNYFPVKTDYGYGFSIKVDCGLMLQNKGKLQN